MFRLRSVIPLVAVIAVVAGCGTKQTAQTSSGTKAKWTIGMSQCTTREPWRVQMNADIKAAADKHPELNVIFKDADDRATTQQDQVRELVSQGVNLIIISPKEAVPLTKPVAEAYQKGIPVIVLDRKVEGDKYTTFIGADNVKIGEEAGKFMVKLLGGKGKIVELKGNMSSTPGQERHNGFMQGIKGSKIDIIFSQDCDWKQDKAQAAMNSALSRFPQIDAVYGHNDPAAYGAYNAAKLEGKGREKTIKFIGIDSLPNEGVKYVKDGILTATFQYPTGGDKAIETALDILNGKKAPKNITLGTRVFTKDNVNKGGQAL
jgi:ribose transport system substrate-binding protein